MQWKQLLVLLLGCTSGPLQTHTRLFTAFLQAVTAQLQLGLGLEQQQQTPPHTSAAATEGASSDSQQQDSNASAGFGLAAAGGLVDELLPDSFLKAAFRGFFEVLQEAGGAAPAALLAEVRFGYLALQSFKSLVIIVSNCFGLPLGWFWCLSDWFAGNW
jgi:hypothetical protein